MYDFVRKACIFYSYLMATNVSVCEEQRPPLVNTEIQNVVCQRQPHAIFVSDSADTKRAYLHPYPDNYCNTILFNG